MSLSAATEISVVSDGLDRYRARIVNLAEPLVGTPQDDLLSALYEAERSIRGAMRALDRAKRLAG